MRPAPAALIAALIMAAVGVAGTADAQTASPRADDGLRRCLRSAVLRMEESGRSPAELAAAAERQCVRAPADDSRSAAARDDARLAAAKTVVAYRLCKRSAACEFAPGR